MLLVDAKERRYLITLRPGATFHTHVGIVDHDDLIGAREGSTVLGSTGRRFLVVRPTLSDAVLKMPRGAQVIYPKDLGAILIEADISPGVRVLEAGVGSGALSMALLRAGAEVVGYELREDFADRARANVAAMVGERPPTGSSCATSTRASSSGGSTGSCSISPSPGGCLPTPAAAMRPGGILCAYLPSINQTAQLRTPWRSSDSGWPPRSRSCTARGTSRTARCARTTGWWATPGSSPPPDCCCPSTTPDADPSDRG